MSNENLNLARWISVIDSLPKHTGDYIVTDGYHRTIGTWSECYEDWDAWLMASDNITHWMPLPELPKQ